MSITLHTTRLETLLMNLPGMAYRCLNESHWPMDFVSQGCFDLCGYRRKEIENQSILWGDFTHPDDIDSVDQMVRSATDKGESFEVEYRIITKGGEIKWVWERGRVVHVRRDGVAVLEGFITDITTRKQSEAELHARDLQLREQRELLAHVDRLNTLGEMAAAIAHEINQPLTAISTHAQSGLRFLRKSPPTMARVEEGLKLISTQARRAGVVIERIQMMARRQDGNPEVVNVGTLVRGIYHLAELEAQSRNFAIELDLCDEAPAVLCDRVQIQQVILNLLRNGMESMSAEACQINTKIQLCSECVEGGVRIAIVDSGAGISDQVAAQLFEPFRSSKQLGMGLGLSISRSIVVAHDSTLEYFDNPNGGTTFRFTLASASTLSHNAQGSIQE